MDRNRISSCIAIPLCLLRHCLLALLWWHPLLALASEPAIEIGPDVQSLPLARGVQYYVDAEDRLSIQSLLQSSDELPWQPVGDETANFGFDHRTYWYRLSLQFAPDAHPFLLQVDNPLLDFLDFYIISDEQLVSSQYTGDMHPFYQRQVQNRSFLFPLDAKDQTLQLYFRVSTDSPQRLPLILWDPATFDQQDRIVMMGHSFYFGIVFVMIIYNLAMFFSVRDFNYLIYVASVAAFALFDASMNGYTFQYLWPESVHWNDKGPMCFLNLFILLRAFFIFYFLNLRAFGSLLVRIHCVFILLTILSLLSVFVAPIQQAITLGLALGFVGLIIGQVEGILLWSRGMTHARFFVVGWTVFMICLLLHLLAQVRLIPLNTFTMLMTQVGSATEIILFTFALADRVRLLQKERNELELQKQEALRVANRSLAESLRVKDEFLATISHELRTPMNGVIASLDSIQSSQNLVEIKRFGSTGYQSAREMMGLVEGILGYTEMQSGQFELEQVEFSLRKLCEKLKAAFQTRAEAKGLRFELAIADPLPDRLLGDPRRLEQILSCLLDNAIKFTHQGHVAFSVTPNQVAASQSEPTADRIGVQFCVADSGIGVAADERAQIFQKFRQVDGSYHRSYGGLGLGLTISQTLVSAMGGTLECESQLGAGSQFKVTLNFSYLPERRQPTESRHSRQLTRPARVLVVEDNSVNQMVMKALLQKIGADVLVAEDGTQAVQCAQSEALDLILMDLQMPVMDGFTATQRIRALSIPVATVPIIAVTANVMDSDRKRCRECGMNDFVGKPVSWDKLNEIISKWLRD